MDVREPCDRSSRALICAGCGETLVGPVTATRLDCHRCGRHHELPPRDERAELAAARAARAGLREEDRLAGLLAQDGQDLPTPPGLEDLAGTGVRADNHADAFARWQQARLLVAEEGDPAAAARLAWLSRILRSYYSYIDHDELRGRAIVETSLDLLPDPVVRQVLRCALARSAASRGDLDCAEGWLAACDPDSPSLDADTQYRLARAYLATRQERYREVLHLLGRRLEDVPLADTGDFLAAVLRANALERTGRLAEAAAGLARVMAGGGESSIARCVAFNPEIDPCPQSLPLARTLLAKRRRQDRWQWLGRALARRGGHVWLIVGAAEVALGLVALCLAALALTVGGLEFLSAAPRGVLALAGLVLLLTGLPLGGLGLLARHGAKLERRLRREGRPASARVIKAFATGRRAGGRPELAFVLSVQAAGEAAYRTLHRDVVPVDGLGPLAGAVLPVRVDPTDPGTLTVEWEGARPAPAGRRADAHDPEPPPDLAAVLGQRKAFGASFGSVLAVLGPLLGIFAFGNMSTCMGFEDEALRRLRACPGAVELLGAPVARARLGLSCGSAETGGGRGNASWMLPVQGSKQRGSYKVVMEDRGSGWTLLEGYLSVGEVELDVVQCTLAASGQGVATLRKLSGEVVSALGSAPVPPGTPCTVELGPGGGPFGCRVQVRCGGQLLYGGEHLGFVKCRLQPRPDGPPAIVAQDPEGTATSGDPILDFQEARGEVLISDQGAAGLWALTIRLPLPPSVPAEEAAP